MVSVEKRADNASKLIAPRGPVQPRIGCLIRRSPKRDVWRWTSWLKAVPCWILAAARGSCAPIFGRRTTRGAHGCGEVSFLRADAMDLAGTGDHAFDFATSF